jgi:pantothenate kinase
LSSTLVEAVRSRLAPGSRLLVGISGSPGAGKSTLAGRLAAAFPGSVVVPMDGFHLANVELERLGYADRKGAPFTFDVLGFAALLRRIRLRDEEIVYAPSFDHVQNEPIAGSIPVPASAQLVVTEGNYLLYWEPIRSLLDLTVHVSADSPARIAGLIERQIAKGLSSEAARDWVMRSDEANARLVERYAHLADVQLSREDCPRSSKSYIRVV